MMFMRKSDSTASMTGRTNETTLFDLLERMNSLHQLPGSEHICRTFSACNGNGNERFIADTLARMFESGQLRFKDPGKVKQAFQELFS